MSTVNDLQAKLESATSMKALLQGENSDLLLKLGEYKKLGLVATRRAGARPNSSGHRSILDTTTTTITPAPRWIQQQVSIERLSTPRGYQREVSREWSGDHAGTQVGVPMPPSA
jgi:hypothetical protein